MGKRNLLRWKQETFISLPCLFLCELALLWSNKSGDVLSFWQTKRRKSNCRCPLVLQVNKEKFLPRAHEKFSTVHKRNFQLQRNMLSSSCRFFFFSFSRKMICSFIFLLVEVYIYHLLNSWDTCKSATSLWGKPSWAWTVNKQSTVSNFVAEEIRTQQWKIAAIDVAWGSEGRDPVREVGHHLLVLSCFARSSTVLSCAFTWLKRLLKI